MLADTTKALRMFLLVFVLPGVCIYGVSAGIRSVAGLFSGGHFLCTEP